MIAWIHPLDAVRGQSFAGHGAACGSGSRDRISPVFLPRPISIVIPLLGCRDSLFAGNNSIDPPSSEFEV
jgi:hypothetical protein